jgi:glycosyltransferase involved in cell wall biosynthesis
LAFEIYRALQSRPDAAEVIRFVRHQPARNSFRVVQWHQIEALFTAMTATPQETSGMAHLALSSRRFEEARDTGPILPHPRGRQFVRKLVHRLPPALRVYVIDFLLTQNASLRALGRLINALGRGVASGILHVFRPRRRSGPAMQGSPEMANNADFTGRQSAFRVYGEDTDESFTTISAPGDILLVLGSPWSHPDYASMIAPQRRRGLKFGLLVYDLIPLRRPEWCDRNLVRLFRAWFESVFPLCDEVFAISQATARDVEAYTRERGIALCGPVRPIPIGSVFSQPECAVAAPKARPMPEAGSYALIVSTIEARKNHMLLFRVWRKLLEECPPDQVPTLVFAGRVGWLVEDLIRQIANTDCLDGKLVVIENPTDAELVTLYRGCLFTLFPSFFEGWGLPVTESLSFGKPCLTSNSTSLPEAGGSLTRRFDPDNLNDAYAAILDVIRDPADLARWEAQVKREFRPIPWSETADALLAGLGHPGAAMAERSETTQPASRVVSIAR